MGSNSWYFLSRQTKVLGGLILLSLSFSLSLALSTFLHHLPPSPSLPLSFVFSGLVYPF